MLPYRLLYSKNSVLILTIILLPIVGMGIMFAILFNLPKDLPDWVIYAAIFFFLALIVVSLLAVIKRQLSVPCKAFVDENGISFKLESKSYLYRYNEFFSGWENVTNISESSYNEQGNFYQISFKNPTFTANFSPLKNQEEAAGNFFDELTYYQDLYNLSHASTRISSRNFYEGTWAKMITWLFYIMLIAIPIVYITIGKNFEWWRIISFLCIGGVWIGNYYSNTKKLY